jgi:hypothetical protein
MAKKPPKAPVLKVKRIKFPKLKIKLPKLKQFKVVKYKI